MLGFHVIRCTPFSFRQQVAIFYQFLDSQFQRAGFAAGELDELAESERFVVGEEGEDLFGEWVDIGGYGVFAGNLFCELVFLFRERAEEDPFVHPPAAPPASPQEPVIHTLFLYFLSEHICIYPTLRFQEGCETSECGGMARQLVRHHRDENRCIEKHFHDCGMCDVARP